MVICLERDANDLHMVQLMPLPPHHVLLQQNQEWWFIRLVPAYPGCPGKKAVERLCVCVWLCLMQPDLMFYITKQSITLVRYSGLPLYK